jgi:hypothetical protein
MSEASRAEVGDSERRVDNRGGEGFDIDRPQPPGLSFVDLTISVPPTMSVREAHDVESQVREAVMTARREVRELKVHVHSFDEEEPEQKVEMNGKDRVVKSDFGRDGC